MKTVLIFVPVFDDADALLLLTEEILELVDGNQGYENNLVLHFCFLLDGSPVGTYDAALSIVERHSATFSMICYSRNYGYERALTHSINFANSDALIFLDCDGEDPPEMIFDFIEHWMEGERIVYGYRFDRPENRTMKKLRHAFYDVLKIVSDGNSIPRMANFLLMDSSIYKNLQNLDDNFPFLRFKIANLGFSPRGIKYTRRSRIAGKSAYNFYGNVKYAFAGILSSSTWALRIVGISGFGLAAIIPFSVLGKFDNPLLDVAIDLFYVTSLSLILVYLSRFYSNSIRLDKPIVDVNRSVINTDLIDILFYEK